MLKKYIGLRVLSHKQMHTSKFVCEDHGIKLSLCNILSLISKKRNFINHLYKLLLGSPLEVGVKNEM